jgi:hypothetical protein
MSSSLSQFYAACRGGEPDVELQSGVKSGIQYEIERTFVAYSSDCNVEHRVRCWRISKSSSEIHFHRKCILNTSFMIYFFVIRYL